MDEMKLLEEFCAAEPDPRPDRLTRARSDLTARIVAGRRVRRMGGWLAPVAAAGAVVAAIAVPLAVLPSPSPKPARPASAPGGPGGTPPYFLRTPWTGNDTTELQIGSTATAKTLATASIPYGHDATPLGPAVGDRTFLVGATPTGGPFLSVFYLARFDPGRKAISLTRLPMHSGPSANSDHGYSLSPDGTKVALTQLALLRDRQTGKLTGQLSVTVTDVTTGSSRTWTRLLSPLPVPPGALASTWLAGSQQIEITWVQSQTLFSDRLNIAAPGTGLPVPRPLAPLAAWARGKIFTNYVAPDGDVVFMLSQNHIIGRMGILTLAEYFAGTHRFSQILGPVHGVLVTPHIGWVTGNGQVTIPVGLVNGLGYVSHGHYTPLPQPPGMNNYPDLITW